MRFGSHLNVVGCLGTGLEICVFLTHRHTADKHVKRIVWFRLVIVDCITCHARRQLVYCLRKILALEAHLEVQECAKVLRNLQRNALR